MEAKEKPGSQGWGGGKICDKYNIEIAKRSPNSINNIFNEVELNS